MPTSAVTSTPWYVPTLYWVDQEEAPSNAPETYNTCRLKTPHAVLMGIQSAEEPIEGENCSIYDNYYSTKVKLGEWYKAIDGSTRPSTDVPPNSTICGMEVIVFSRPRLGASHMLNLGVGNVSAGLHEVYVHYEESSFKLGEAMPAVDNGKNMSQPCTEAGLFTLNADNYMALTEGFAYIPATAIPHDKLRVYHPYNFPLSAYDSYVTDQELYGVEWTNDETPYTADGVLNHHFMSYDLGEFVPDTLPSHIINHHAGTQIGHSLSFAVDTVVPSFPSIDLTGDALDALNDIWIDVRIGEDQTSFAVGSQTISAVYVKFHYHDASWTTVGTTISAVDHKTLGSTKGQIYGTNLPNMDSLNGGLVIDPATPGQTKSTTFLHPAIRDDIKFYGTSFSFAWDEEQRGICIEKDNLTQFNSWSSQGYFVEEYRCRSQMYDMWEWSTNNDDWLRFIEYYWSEDVIEEHIHEVSDLPMNNQIQRLVAPADYDPPVSEEQLNGGNYRTGFFFDRDLNSPSASRGAFRSQSIRLSYSFAEIDPSETIVGISIPTNVNSELNGCTISPAEIITLNDGGPDETIMRALFGDPSAPETLSEMITSYPYIFENIKEGAGICLSLNGGSDYAINRKYECPGQWHYSMPYEPDQSAGGYFGLGEGNNSDGVANISASYIPFVAANMYPNSGGTDYFLGGDLFTNIKNKLDNGYYFNNRLSLEFKHGDLVLGNLLGVETRPGWLSKWQTIPQTLTIYQLVQINRQTEEVADVRDFDSVDPDLPLSITAIGGVSYASLSVEGLGNKFLVMGSETAVGPPPEEPPVNVNDLYFLGTGHNADNVPTAPEAFDGATETQSTINAASGTWTVNGDGTHPKLSSGTTVAYSSWLNIYQWFGGPLGAFSGNQYIRTDPSLWGNDPLNEFMTPNVDINFFNNLYPTHTAPASFVLSFKLSQNGNETGSQPGLLTIELMTVEDGTHGSNDGTIPADSSVPLNFIVNGTAYTSLGTQINTNQNSSYTHSGRIETGFVDPATGSGDDIPGWTPVIVNIPDPPSMFRVKFTYLRRPVAPFWGTNIPPPNEAGTAVPVPHRPVVAFDNFSIKGSLVDSTDLGGGGGDN